MSDRGKKDWRGDIDHVELVWAGKYDEKGELRKVDRTILPFQVVETVNESKADRETARKVARDLFTHQARDDAWRNMLIWGDNKVVMSSLLPRFAGKVNLIYIDPPFATGQDFSYRVQVGDQEFTKEPSVIEEKAYRDTWGRGLDSYLQMMYDRLLLMRELLSDGGCIYVHIDPFLGGHVKLLLDEVFGAERFLNQIAWKRQSAKSGAFGGIGQYGRTHENILFYSKSDSWVWHQQFGSYDEEYVDAFYKYAEPATGRRYRLSDLTAAGSRKGQSGGPVSVSGEKVNPASGRHWALGLKRGETVQDAMDRLLREGRIWHERGKMPAYKRYLDEMAGVALQDVWTDVRPVAPQGLERLGYDTQKPEALLERIINTSSDEGGLVADFFCGSGTTGAVAEKLGRRWVMCDLSKWAIQVTRKRLLQIEGCKPFEVLNLGNYERHKLAANGQWGRYVQFVLELYRAEPVANYRMLHGRKGRAFVHVGSVDSPITMREIRETLGEAKKSEVREVHFLGWDFEMGLHDLTEEITEQFGVKVRLVSIPKESLEVTNPVREEVRFFDLNYLNVEAKAEKRVATVRLKDFVIANPEYLPEEVRAGVKKFTDCIDYWSVDWEYGEDTFHNGWQSFRTRKKTALDTEAQHQYEKAGTYKVLVKVVDIFGNDTTKMLQVKVN